VNQMMTRIDNLKANSDTSCEKTRRLTKRCKPETNTKKSAKGDYSVDPFPISRARQPRPQQDNKGLYLFRRAIEQEVEQAVIIRQSLIISSNRATKAHSHLLDSYSYSILCPIAN